VKVVTSGFAADLWPKDIGPVEVRTANIGPSVKIDEIPPFRGGPQSVERSMLQPRIVQTEPAAPIELADFSELLERGAHPVLLEQTKLYGPMARRVFSNEAMLGLGLDTYA
jgi:hypothetical protein